MVRTRLVLLCMTLLTHFALGCSSDKGFSEEAEKANLRTIHKAYWNIAGYHNRPPKDAEELNTSIKDLHALEMGGPLEEVLVSPRDKEPYVIILQARPTEDSKSILAYEKTGADNTRWVVDLGGDIRQIPHEEFASQSFAGGHKPSS